MYNKVSRSTWWSHGWTGRANKRKGCSVLFLEQCFKENWPPETFSSPPSCHLTPVPIRAAPYFQFSSSDKRQCYAGIMRPGTNLDTVCVLLISRGVCHGDLKPNTHPQRGSLLETQCVLSCSEGGNSVSCFLYCTITCHWLGRQVSLTAGLRDCEPALCGMRGQWRTGVGYASRALAEENAKFSPLKPIPPRSVSSKPVQQEGKQVPHRPGTFSCRRV